MWQTCSCLHFLDHFMHECNLYKAIIKNVKFPINHNIIPDNFLFLILFAYDIWLVCELHHAYQLLLSNISQYTHI